MLHSACQGGCVSLVQTLIREYKADINALDDQNNTPLHVAAFIGKAEVALCLINEFGCDPNVKGRVGRSVLHSACDGGSVSLVQTLIREYKADINAQDDENNAPLHLAAFSGKAEVAFCLINDFGCDPNVKGRVGRSVLHSACLGGSSIRLVQTLLSRGLSLLSTDNEGNTPLHIASSSSHSTFMEFLLSLNAPPLIRNKRGQTPVDVATGRAKLVLEQYLKANQRKLQVDYNEVLQLAVKRYSGGQPVIWFFILGNPGAGKSSLVKSLTIEGFIQSLMGVSESSVPPHTAGIIPSFYESKDFGRVLFFDFAGDPEYYSSHASILENLACSMAGGNIVAIVVDLSVSEASIADTFHYWFSFMQYQKFAADSIRLVVVGSHSDLLSKKQISVKKESLFKLASERAKTWKAVKEVVFFSFDCRRPTADGMILFKSKITSWAGVSKKITLSREASLLLGLLEKDFSNVTTCSFQTLTSHISDYVVCLPTDRSALYSILLELHKVGIILLLGDCTRNMCQVVLKPSTLTNEVHRLLFSKSARDHLYSKQENLVSLNIGIIPTTILQEILPPDITKQCLSYLQYCQEIEYEDISAFTSLSPVDALNESFLFFPALCSENKSKTTLVTTPATFNYSIGWVARCKDLWQYFPTRFLHVLLLKLVFRFTLAKGKKDSRASIEQHRCTMWKTGVNWLMGQGVECLVELVNSNKAVVVVTRSKKEWEEHCVDAFLNILSCVLEAKADFCQPLKLDFYFLNSTAEADYLKDDNLFDMADVELALTNSNTTIILSVANTTHIESSRLFFCRQLTHWHRLFPIDFISVLNLLGDIVRSLYMLGIHLDLSKGALDAIEENFPADVERRRREVVSAWLSSSVVPPCWWHLVQALKKIKESALAKKIEDEHSKLC